MTDFELNIVAHHEAGHALVAFVLKHTEPPVKISIVPRGRSALGFTQQEQQDIKIYTKEQLVAKLCVLFGGRVAENIIFGHLSTGAHDDLEKANEIARNMITRYGMGTSCVGISENSSDYMRGQFDQEICNILKLAEKETHNIISLYLDQVKLVANYLGKYETITTGDISNLLDGYDIRAKIIPSI